LLPVSDVNKIQEGIGDKMGGTLQYFSTLVSGLAIAFARSWKLTLVAMAFSPLLGACGAVTMKVRTQKLFFSQLVSNIVDASE
jgi:ABC-type bacteriocin/lantibiotic exporter with double-glycine peptidase domain